MPCYWVTPLALRLPGAGPIRFARGPAAHRFDLAGDGRSDPILWPRVMWIVRMPAAGEELTSAHLFGSNTLGGWWTDGFAALRATVPGAEDGRLTAAEAAAAGVGIWIDHDMNRRADGGEVLPLAAFGVASIETHAADQERLWWAPEGYVQGQANAPLSDGGTLGWSMCTSPRRPPAEPRARLGRPSAHMKVRPSPR